MCVYIYIHTPGLEYLATYISINIYIYLYIRVCVYIHIYTWAGVFGSTVLKRSVRMGSKMAESGGNARNKSTATEMHSLCTYFDYL